MSNFFPTNRSVGLNIEGAHKYHLEFAKAQLESESDLVERCLVKCSANFRDTSNGDRETVCLTQCFNKFLDSKLLIRKEITKHTFLAPIQ